MLKIDHRWRHTGPHREGSTGVESNLGNLPSFNRIGLQGQVVLTGYFRPQESCTLKVTILVFTGPF